MNDPARRTQSGRPGRLHRLRADALAFEHPDDHLVSAFETARERAVIPVADEDDTPRPRLVAFERAALAAYAALAIGAHDQARTRIAALAAERAGLVIAWLIGRYFAYTGDPEATRWLPPAVEALRIAATLDDGAASQHRDPLLAIVARELIAPAEAAGDAGTAGIVRRLAGGAAPGRSVDIVLTRLADVSAAQGDRSPRDTLASLLDGRTAAAVPAWEEIARSEDASERDWLIPLLCAGVLGIDPDSDRGRLRTRLHVPATWQDWRAGNIRIGDAAVDLRVARDRSTVTITADQTTGALPLTLILEPVVHAPVRACFVDGHPADLALRASADQVVVPVQLALDALRTLTIELDDPGPGTGGPDQ